jgi:hypothetical protein
MLDLIYVIDQMNAPKSISLVSLCQDAMQAGRAKPAGLSSYINKSRRPRYTVYI